MTNEQAPALASFLQVLEAGRAAGYWQVLHTEAPELENRPPRYATIRSPEGHQFYLTGPSYSQKDTIGGSVDGLKDSNGIRVDVRDVSREAAPHPRESLKKTPEVIARNLNKRLLQNPEAVALCVAVEERMAKLQASHKSLREHVAKVEALGFDCGGLSGHETFQARGCRRGSDYLTVNVYADGRITFEAATTVDKLESVLAALAAP